MRKDGSLIIQSDNTVLLDGRHITSKEAAEQLARFADLVKRPGDLHTYRLTPLSVWNACAAGGTAQQMLDTLQAFSKYEVPMTAASNIREWADRYGKLCLRHQHGAMTLTVDCEAARALLMDKKAVGDALLHQLSDNVWEVKPSERGRLKQELLRQGYPVLDLAGYHAGESLKVALLQKTKSGRSFRLRDYQEQAADLFYSEGNVHGGSGVLVLPCGAGKTVVGIAALSRLNCATLILTSNVTSVKQWKNELLDKTTLTPAEVGEYAGPLKQVRPVTIATYQIMTHRSSKQHEYTHMKLFRERDWGLIIYDEVHLLPAPVFRMTAEIQATRRLGLTATLVREDGCEGDVFSLIGPKRFDMPWKQLEQQGWIASVSCTEFRVPLTGTYAECYYQAAPKGKLRLASENPIKADVVQSLLDLHEDKQMLIIGQYLTQLRQLADRFKLPLLTGSTPHHEREMWFNRFKAGDVRALIVSKVANFAIDLPDAAVAVQVSGSFGSRQEEAQRIGRILRPKPNANEAWFYSVVTNGTKETEFALKRQLFMTEQGYQYQLVNWSEHKEMNGEQAQEVAK